LQSHSRALAKSLTALRSGWLASSAAAGLPAPRPGDPGGDNAPVSDAACPISTG